MRKSAWWARLLCALSCLFALQAAAGSPPLMLANVYRPGMAVRDYWVSEKYDGVRGYWDGRQLLSRSGAVIAAPAWFTADWPATPMDGELWIARGEFEQVSGTVRRMPPDDRAWRRVRYMVFDLPAQAGSFDRRIPVLQKLVAGMHRPWVRVVAQEKVADEAALRQRLDQVVRAGGEGLVLHRGASLYHAGRDDDLLKLKPYQDGEAKVIGYSPGKGKYQGMLGALLVEGPDGTRFRIGGGLSDAQRRHPPALGSVVTFRYQGTTSSGKPRFARFMRVREEP